MSPEKNYSVQSKINISGGILTNQHHLEVVKKHLNKSGMSLLSKMNHANSLMPQPKKRATAPTFKTNSPPRVIVSRNSPPRRKSSSPSSISVNTTSQETIKNTSDAHETTDDECSSLEDDDNLDDLGEAGDDLDITDDEDEAVRSQINFKSFSNESFVYSIDCVQGSYSTTAPFSPSLFPNCPPYITFASHLEKGPPMPSIVHKILKWKLTTITPIIVRKILVNSGFKLLKKTNDWVGTWGKHMKSPCFKTIRSYQKINHIPGTFQIGRKDRIWRNLHNQMTRHGKKEFNFMPRCVGYLI